MDYRIDLLSLPKRYGKTTMLFKGQSIGVSNTPIYAAARWLLDNGLACPDDVVSTYRGETISMTGKTGKLAKWMVIENNHGNPSLVHQRWKAFRACRASPMAAETHRVVG